jgi:hypothetical protein
MISFSVKKGIYGTALLLLFYIGICLISMCSGESEERIRKKLEVICTDDLTAIIDSVDVDNLIEKPYYKVVSYTSYTEGKYTKKAVVEFYFLKKVHVKVVRKYRYHLSVGMWDRYSNEYVFIHDTTGNASK